MKNQKRDPYLKACGILMIAAMRAVQLIQKEKYGQAESILLRALERIDEPLFGDYDYADKEKEDGCR